MQYLPAALPRLVLQRFFVIGLSGTPDYWAASGALSPLAAFLFFEGLSAEFE